MMKSTRATLLISILVSVAACSGGPSPASPLNGKADACGVAPSTGPGLSVTVLGDPTTAYDGQAVVERSTAQELLLAFPGGTTDALPRHANIRGLGATPLFAPAAQVWLTVDLRLGPPSGQLAVSSRPTMAVREKKDGRLLFASAIDGGGPLPTAPGTSSCVAPYQDVCGVGTLTHTSLVVSGDSPVEVSDGQTRTVRIDGFDYDVAVQSSTADVRNLGCIDYVGGKRSFAMIEIRARDLPALAARLEAGTPPACSRGNGEAKGSFFGFYNVDDATVYAGPVVYTRRGDDQGAETDCFAFSVPGLTAQRGLPPPVLNVCASRGLVAEPAVGQTLWATVNPISAGTLRASEHGALLLAGAWGDGDYSAVASQIAQEVGVSVEARARCAYAAAGPNGAPWSLPELVFATTPAVTLQSEGHAVVTIDGQDFDAWMSWGDAQVTLAPR